jgi:hypothetical protein
MDEMTPLAKALFDEWLPDAVKRYNESMKSK